MHVAYLRLYGGKFEWLGDRLCWSQICVCAPSVGRNSRRRVPSAEVKENVTLFILVRNAVCGGYRNSGTSRAPYRTHLSFISRALS